MENIFYYEDITRISNEGIVCNNNGMNVFISFKECVANFASENSLETTKCVASRDISQNIPIFTFYTIPKTIILFRRRSFLFEFFSRKSSTQFYDLQRQIYKFNYTLYDLS